jgi:hypothetical protein
VEMEIAEDDNPIAKRAKQWNEKKNRDILE